MAHSRLADSSIPEPSEEEAAVADASARKIQKERHRGGNQARDGEGRREGKTEASPRVLVCDQRLSLLEQRLPALPRSACPPLKPPPTRPELHLLEWQRATHTHAGFCIFEKKTKRVEPEKQGEGDDQ